jgi:hypothetical protein
MGDAVPISVLATLMISATTMVVKTHLSGGVTLMINIALDKSVETSVPPREPL